MKTGLPEEERLAVARARLLEMLAGIVGEGPIGSLTEALTHPSFANESTEGDNQRLELLGDSVLGLVVTETLLAGFPKANEGELTRMRSALVNGDALAQWGRKIALGECLALGRGARTTERDQTNVLADAVEALIAAVYLSHGLAGAKLLVAEVTRELATQDRELGSLDPKSELQEEVQAEGGPSPRYRVVESSGPAHDPLFVVVVLVGEAVVARGEGRSKRLAERAAATAALEERALSRGAEPA
jgi:ribonuclease-3